MGIFCQRLCVLKGVWLGFCEVSLNLEDESTISFILVRVI